MVMLALACVWASPAAALEVTHEGSATVVHVQKGDRSNTTSSSGIHHSYSLPGDDDQIGWEGYPIIQVTPDLFTGGWFACDQCGPAIATKELVIRLDRPSVITLEDPARMGTGEVPLSIRVEASSAKVADGSALQLHFDRSDVTRDDAIVIRNRSFDFDGDGRSELDMSGIRMRAFELWTGAGNDTVDARGAGVYGQVTSWFKYCCQQAATVDLGDGNDVIAGPEQLADRLDLGRGDDRATLVGASTQPLTINTDGGSDTIDASSSPLDLQVYARTQEALTITLGRGMSEIRSYARHVSIDGRKSRSFSAGLVGHDAAVTGGRGNDHVEFTGRGRFRINMGGGADEVASLAARATGTLGPGKDKIEGLGPFWFSGHHWPAGSIRGVSCGPGTDDVIGGRPAGSGCERRLKTGAKGGITFRTDVLQHAFTIDRWYEVTGQVNQRSEFGLLHEPESPVVSADAEHVVLRPGPDLQTLSMHLTKTDGVTSWGCHLCPAIAPTAQVDIQVQHPLTVKIDGLNASAAHLPPLTVTGYGKRSSYARIETIWTGAADIRLVGRSLQWSDAPVVVMAGVPFEVATISTGSLADQIDLSRGDGSLAWRVESGMGADRVTGSPWDDGITTKGRGAVVNGGAGNDSVDAEGGPSILDGGVGDDFLAATAAGSTIRGGPGFDDIVTRRGSRLVDGGPGDDRIEAAGGSDVLHGGSGHDLITKRSGVLGVDGGSGNDFIQPYHKVLLLGANCGSGIDTLWFATSSRARLCEDVTTKRGEGIWYDGAHSQFFEAGRSRRTFDDPHFEPTPPDAQD
ncbi:MAG: hypothetical protein JWM86_983 [Thermoleophilia bacterium]|nr:hypothetical protein [Thermoleophilia bacterium]